jgi:hypothetical protein
LSGTSRKLEWFVDSTGVRIALNEQQFALLLAIYGVIGATFLVKGLT